MILPAQALFHGRAMYGVTLPPGAGPVSPGPAWIVRNSPFALLHIYELMIPFWMALTAAVFRRFYRCGLEINLGLALIFCSPHLYIEMAQGEDTVAFSLAVLVVFALADRYLTLAETATARRSANRVAVVVGLLAGVAATARFIYLPLPILAGVLVWRRNRAAAVVVGVTLAVATNLVASLGLDVYPPAHLFARSQLEPTLTIAIGAITTVAVVAMMLWRRRTGIVNWLGWTAACLAVPHAFIGLGELEGTHFDYSIWEGANYLFIGAVLVVAAVLAERAGSTALRSAARSPATSTRR